MSPSPGEEVQSAQDSRSTGGLASVFKGLAGATKLTKSTPTPLQISGPSMNTNLAEQLNDAASHGLPPNHMDAFEQLRNGTAHERVAAAQQLRYVVVDYPLNPVLDIWYAAKDMIEPSNASVTRIAGWELLTACVKHESSTDLERKEYFQTVTALANSEDFHLQLAALVDLTNHGRNLSGFEYDAYPLVTNWLEMKFDSVRAARKQASRAKGKAVASGEDKDFAELFAFTTDLVKFNFSVVGDEVAQVLIDALLKICMNTSGSEDLRACIGVLDAVVTFGAIPKEKLKDCVQVLSSIHCLVLNLQKDAWHTMSMLCRSHNGQAVVRILLDVLGSLPADADKTREGTREVRGALSVLHKLVSKSTEKGYPPIPYSLLVDGLSTVVRATSAWKISLDILRLANVLFDGPHGKLNPMLFDEDWAEFLDVAASCIKIAIPSTASSSAATIDDVTKSPTPRDSLETPHYIVGKEVTKLISRIEELLAEKPGPILQRQDCIVFFTKINKILPDSAAILVLDYFQEFRCCFPSDVDWEANLRFIVDSLFADRTRSTQLRFQALQAIMEVHDMAALMPGQVPENLVKEVCYVILKDLEDETDFKMLTGRVSAVAGIASKPDTETCLFTDTVDSFRKVLTVNRIQSPVPPVIPRSSVTPASSEAPKSSFDQTPSNVVVKAVVQMFMEVMHTDVAKALQLFTSLICIAKSNSAPTDARLTAMKLLFRLRADWANRVYVTTHTESASLAATLCRTDASLAKKQAEDAVQFGRSSRGEAGSSGRISRGVSFGQGQTQERSFSMRSGGGTRSAAPRYQQLWTATDADALPGDVTRTASSILFSHRSDSTLQGDEGSPREATLPTWEWLDLILNLFQQGCDWEILSYVLVYLPSQLSNHGIFKGAISQIQELRKVLCDQIRTNGFQEPPSAPALRRADVAICLFHNLTMILSYHRHFQKTEEDEVVSTFVRGIATWERSAKCCIHALSVCCYELPMSTSKSLVTTLQKMAQIITQPTVAIHILEFLACLARRPSLYVNFREDEYKIVFGICFRYLQYVREKKQTHRASTASDPASSGSGTPTLVAEGQAHPNASDDLPQYVYALAYHVITFWFLALKLPDRANLVGWIVKNLFTDVDGSQVAEEQAQITIDFMQRVAYADVDESAANPGFNSETYGEILKKRWLIGSSIVTVEQATSSGWAQITKRQPSGTSSYMIQESFKAPPAHQECTTNEVGRDGNPGHGNVVLPSHLLVQLLSSMPQCTDQARPIPLPEDESVDRAIKVFDLTSIVDGHKVGVIYIGENQTKESEILANVSGSSEYVEFLNGLGTLTKLKGATFNTQGLDRGYDSDGEFTVCWRDRVTEMVFHVVTQMPTNLEQDPQCTMKKRHIGNDFVNIIFNDSGLPFRFDTFPSDFNFVNIVITPESRASFVATRQRAPIGVKESFYNVQVMSKPGFPEISPASEMKIISLRALPDFIRLIALNASVFSLVWAHRAGGEHISPWRKRLQDILKLRSKYGPNLTSHGALPSPPGTAFGGGPPPGAQAVQFDTGRPGSTVRDSFSSLRRSSVATFFSNTSEPNTHSHRSSTLSTVTTEGTEIMHGSGGDTLVDKLDFSKWA